MNIWAKRILLVCASIGLTALLVFALHRALTQQSSEDTPPKNYKAVIFDIGGVLITEPYTHAQVTMLVHKITSSLHEKKFWRTITSFNQERKAVVDPAMMPIWNKLLRGTPAKEVAQEIIDTAAHMLGKDHLDSLTADDILDVFSRTGAYAKLSKYGVRLLKRLKEKGYKIYLLSNTGPEYLAYEQGRKDLAEIFSLADGSLYSFEVGAIKPEPAIYKALLTKYNLKADECLFFDNHQEMIDGAQAVGIDGIVYKNYDKVIRELKRKKVV